MPLLLDTDWAVFALRGRAAIVQRIEELRAEGLAISTVTLAELVTGVHRSEKPRLSQFDLAIAATALHHDLTLLTENRKHFERVPGLKIQSLSAAG